MNVSNARARIELLANTSPAADTEPNVANELAIGLPILTQRFPTANVAYSTRFLIVDGAEGEINLANNDTSNSDEFVAGAAQVETATAAGTITLAGNAAVVFTATGVTGSPITLNVPVTLSDTAAQWAEKVRTALATNSAITAKYAISGTTTAIIATALPSTTIAGVPFHLANVSNLNISLDNGTCTGITTAGTSANTTAGVATSGCKVIGGGGVDVWCDTVPTITSIHGILIEGNSGFCEIKDGGVTFAATIEGSNALFSFLDDTASPFVATLDQATPIADVTITVIGKAVPA